MKKSVKPVEKVLKSKSEKRNKKVAVLSDAENKPEADKISKVLETAGYDVDKIPEPQRPSTPPPMRPNKDLELEKMQWNAINSFMGGRHQNTHINADERLLLSVIFHDMAINPWSTSKRVCQDLGIPFNDKEFEIDILKDFVFDYLDFGIPLDRAGRDEVAQIFKAKFEGDKSNGDDSKKDQKLIS